MSGLPDLTELIRWEIPRYFTQRHFAIADDAYEAHFLMRVELKGVHGHWSRVCVETAVYKGLGIFITRSLRKPLISAQMSNETVRNITWFHFFWTWRFPSSVILLVPQLLELTVLEKLSKTQFWRFPLWKSWSARFGKIHSMTCCLRNLLLYIQRFSS